MQKLSGNGGLYEAICEKKIDPNMQEDDEQQTLKPKQEKEKEEAQNKIKKNSCSWFAQKDQGKFEYHNNTGIYVYCDLRLGWQMHIY